MSTEEFVVAALAYVSILGVIGATMLISIARDLNRLADKFAPRGRRDG